MRNEFGTPHIEQYNPEELLKRLKDLLPALLYFNIKDFSTQLSVNQKKWDDIMDILEALKFGKEKTPHVLTLHFNKDKSKIIKVALWPDPHYENEEGISTVFNGPVNAFGSLSDLAKDPHRLSTSINSLLSNSKDSLTVCLVGTKDSVLNIGLPNEYFNNKKPLLVIPKKTIKLPFCGK